MLIIQIKIRKSHLIDLYSYPILEIYLDHIIYNFYCILTLNNIKKMNHDFIIFFKQWNEKRI